MKNIQTLTFEELRNIEGGSFWYDIAYAIGYASHAIYTGVNNGNVSQVQQRW